jgi:hypothetical protein
MDVATGVRQAAIASDFKRVRYDVVAAGVAFRIEYRSNFLGQGGRRSFEVELPDGTCLVSKPWLLMRGRYYLDFHGMETTTSIKNFICVDKRNQSRELCLLTRKPDGGFGLRISESLPVLHAFALAVTNFHTGIFHR